MGWRHLIVQGKAYKWRGGGFADIRDGDGNSFAKVSAAKIKGITENDWERGQWKNTTDGMLRPGDVAAFIVRTLKDMNYG